MQEITELYIHLITITHSGMMGISVSEKSEGEHIDLSDKEPHALFM